MGRWRVSHHFHTKFRPPVPVPHRSLHVRLKKPEIVHRREGFLHKFKQVLSEQRHEVLRWWEKPAKFFHLFGQHRGHLSQIDMWHCGVQKQKCQRTRESAPEKARNERHLENGLHGGDMNKSQRGPFWLKPFHARGGHCFRVVRHIRVVFLLLHSRETTCHATPRVDARSEMDGCRSFALSRNYSANSVLSKAPFLFCSWTLSSDVLTQDCCCRRCCRCCFSRRPGFTRIVEATVSRCTLEDSSSFQRCSNLVSLTHDVPR